MLDAVWGRVRVLMVMAVLVAAIPLPAGAQEDPRAAEVSQAAVELSQLQRSGDLLMLHDLLHPDVRLVLSRAELAQWYAGPDAAIPTANPEILDVTFGSWAWPVTGRTYADVATVTLRQPATVNGEARELVEIQHYWYDGARWRWFFGTDAAYLEALQAQVPAEPELGGYEDLEYARVNAIWEDIYREAGATYRPPSAIQYASIADMPMMTGCGMLTEDENPGSFYCPYDEEIYLSTEYEAQDTQRFGDYSIRFTISHEWGHHLQIVEGIDVTDDPELDGGYYTIEVELQADCLAGIYAQEAVARGWATAEDLNDAYQVTLFIGDPSGIPYDHPGAHGNGDQRRQAFATGLEDGLFGCYFLPVGSA